MVCCSAACCFEQPGEPPHPARGVHPEYPPACWRVDSAGNLAPSGELMHTPWGPVSAAMVVDSLVP